MIVEQMMKTDVIALKPSNTIADALSIVKQKTFVTYQLLMMNIMSLESSPIVIYAMQVHRFSMPMSI